MPGGETSAGDGAVGDVLSPAKVLEILRQADVNLQEFVSNPKVFDHACKLVHRMLPPPARWALREKGVRAILGRARDLYVRQSAAAIPGDEAIAGNALPEMTS